MSDEQGTITRKELEEKIINKALENENFKKDLMNNPHDAIAQFGVQFPEEVEIKVVEESAKMVYLVLPVNPLDDEATKGCGAFIDCGDINVG